MTRQLDGMLEYYIIIDGSRPGRFREGANAPYLPTAPLSVEANRAFLVL